MDARIVEGADILLNECGRLRSEEAVAIVCDPSTRDIGGLLLERARLKTRSAELIEIPALSMHGEEPPAHAAAAMRDAALTIGLTAKSMAHTRARMAASAEGTRYLSLPDYSFALLADDALRADFRTLAEGAQRVANAFSAGTRVRVTSSAGTDVSMRIGGRVGNCAPGYVAGPGDLGSPPDIEANVSPIEDSAEGVVVVDGSVPFPTIGLLDRPVELTVTNGVIVAMSGPDHTLSELSRLFEGVGRPNAKVLAECGVGLNDRARLTGVMLTDEGSAGTMHFGFGSNSTVGGKNEVPFHLDFVFLEPSLFVDDQRIIDKGVLHT